VDHVVDGDLAEQNVVLVHDGCGDPVVVGKLVGDLALGGRGRYRSLLVVDQFVDWSAWGMREQCGQGHPAQMLVATANHEQVIDVCRQVTAQAQVAEHDVHGGVGAHGDYVRVH